MIVVLMGAPGAGKGTQGDLLVEKYGWVKVSTGDLLRNEIKNGGPRGVELSEIINRGELVSDEILAEILSDAAENLGDKTMLLDGFPRNVSQAEQLKKVCEKNPLLGVFLLDVADEALVERLSGRLVCKDCGASFHKSACPPKVEAECDRCQGALFVRPDDDPIKVQNRLEVYSQHTKPVIEYFKDLGCFVSVDGQGESTDILLRLSSEIDQKLHEYKSGK